MSKYTDEQRKEIVAGLEKAENKMEYCKKVGVSSGLAYLWKRRLSGGAPAVSEPVSSVEFNVVPEEEVIDLLSIQFGRFAEIKRALIRKLGTLRARESMTLQVPEDPKEALALLRVCSAAVRKARMPFRCRYIKSHKIILIARKKEQAAS